MEKRPLLNNRISVTDFRDFYWLKKELVVFCREQGLKTNGGKIDISNRIKHYLETGQKRQASTAHKAKPKSTFNWKKEILSTETEITDNYQNTENVREFFKTQIGLHFKFNVKFMSWMKCHVGSTLKDAITHWHKLKQESKSTHTPKDIDPQFEYNTYLRDFMANNPNSTRKEGIRLWKIKKTLRGSNRYNIDDLNFSDNQ